MSHQIPISTMMTNRTLRWRPNGGDRFKMLLTESLCLRFFHYVGDFPMYEIGHQHPQVVSYIRYQHRCSP